MKNLQINIGDEICWLNSAIEGGDVLHGYVKKIEKGIASIDIHPNYIRAGIGFKLLDGRPVGSLMTVEEFELRYKERAKLHYAFGGPAIQVFLDHASESIMAKRRR